MRNIEDPPTNLLPAAKIRVGAVVVDVRKNQLITENETHQLEPRLVRVFLMLCENAGDVVSREALLDAASSLPYAGDESLTQAISKLRALLGDNSKTPEYIKTVPRRGYILLKSVEPVEPSAEIISVFPRYYSAKLLLGVLSGLIAIAVLAFLFWSSQQGDVEFIEKRDIEFIEQQKE